MFVSASGKNTASPLVVTNSDYCSMDTVAGKCHQRAKVSADEGFPGGANLVDIPDLGNVFHSFSCPVFQM